MKLFDNAFSPFAYKVRVVLYEKGIAFEQMALRTATEREALQRRNPRDEVPALEDGDVVVTDSTIICEYLEERHPAPALLPREPADRARCRTLESFSDGDLDACVFVMGIVKGAPSLERSFAAVLEQAGATLARHHARLEGELGEREYFLGEFSLADIALYPHLRSAAFLGWPVEDAHRRLGAWMSRMGARPSIRRATREMARAFHEFRTDPDPFFSRVRVHWRNDRVEWGIRLGLGRWLLDELVAGRAFFSPAS